MKWIDYYLMHTLFYCQTRKLEYIIRLEQIARSVSSRIIFYLNATKL